MFTITVTHRPSSRFGHDEPEPLAEPLTFGGFRSRTGRRDRIIYGATPQITFESYRRQAKTFVTREAAERNVARLADRGYTAQVVES